MLKYGEDKRWAAIIKEAGTKNNGFITRAEFKNALLRFIGDDREYEDDDPNSNS